MISDSNARPTVVSHNCVRSNHFIVIREHGVPNAHLDPGVQVHRSALKRPVHFGNVGKHHPGPVCVHPLARHVVQSEHDVLGRHDDRFAVRRRQDVVGRHHQRSSLELSLDGQRYVNRHLIAVEVRIECGANQGVKLDRLAFNQNRFERLNAESMQGGRTVE